MSTARTFLCYIVYIYYIYNIQPLNCTDLALVIVNHRSTNTEHNYPVACALDVRGINDDGIICLYLFAIFGTKEYRMDYNAAEISVLGPLTRVVHFDEKFMYMLHIKTGQ